MTVTAYLKGPVNADGTRHTLWPAGDMPYEPVEIIAPYDGLANPSRNRYFVNYTGLEYKVPVIVYGGRLPFAFTLPTKPTNMTIDATTGVITWPGADVTAGTHNVTCTVTDAVGNTDSVSWTITVGTSGHYFIDASVGASGTGTLASPFKAWSDITTGTANGMLWVRAGTYDLTGLVSSGVATWTSKARILQAYPGDAQPILDMTLGRLYFGTSPSFWAGGIKFDNLLYESPGLASSQAILIESNAGDFNVYNCTFNNNGGKASAGETPAPIYISDGGANGYRWSVTNCTFTNLTGEAYGFLGYRTFKAVISNNTMTGFQSGSIPIGAKVHCGQWCVRQNTLNNTAGKGIWLYGFPLTGGFVTDLFFIEHNNIKQTSDQAVHMGEDSNMIFGRIVIRRNTIHGGCGVYIDGMVSGQGPIWMADNILQFSSITFNSPSTPTGDFRGTGDIYTVSGDGTIDSSGDLTTAFQNLRGRFGYQMAS